ncbi:MAG: cupin [Deltaproteobacteria bacterium]|nr:MAG: cupin [Deltaproteobacteria bacterium]
MALLIKNIKHSKIYELADIVEYEKGKVASMTLSQNPGVGVTLFAIDQGEGLNTHSAPGDAMAYILDGQVEIIIDNEKYVLEAGQMIVMPEGLPHSLKALRPFKMMLVLVKKPKV